MGSAMLAEFTGLRRISLRLAVVIVGGFGVAGVLWPGSAVADTPPSCSQNASTVTCIYFFTGAAQSFVVPGGVGLIAVSVSGAQGGAGSGRTFSPSAAGGEGARVQATVPVTSGQTLAVLVGGAGVRGFGAGGFNGGGTGSNGEGDVATLSSGGGGASDLRVAPFGLGQRLVVAGGGGGGGGNGEGAGPGSSGGPAGGRGGVSGGSGMVGSDLSGSVIGGQPGAGGAGQGGAGGNAGTPGGSAGEAGSLGQGGNAGSGSFVGGDGGGGGGGHVGGGGGGGGGSAAGEGAGGGGGGGGSSFVEPLATSESVTNGVQSGNGLIAISYGVPVARAASVTFPGVQLQDTISGVQTIEVLNDGSGALEVSGMTFSGADPQDFVVGFNGCLGPVVAGASCTIGVSFIPQAQGPRTADLNIASNDPSSPLTVALSGTGGAAVQSVTGVPILGSTRAIVLMTCKPTTRRITRKGHKIRVKRLTCSSRRLLGPAKLPITKRDTHATLSRGRTVFATGFAVKTGNGHWQLVLQARRKLRRGSYTLVLRSRHKGRSVTHRAQVLIR